MHTVNTILQFIEDMSNNSRLLGAIALAVAPLAPIPAGIILWRTRVRRPNQPRQRR